AGTRARLWRQLPQQGSQGSRRPRERLQRLGQILLRRRARLEQRGIGVVHRPLDCAERPAQVLDRSLEARQELLISICDELRCTRQRLVETLQVLLQVFADGLQWHPIDLVDDSPDLGLEIGEIAWNCGKLRRRLTEVELHLRGVRMIVDTDVQLPGDEASALELRAQPALFDQASDKGTALLFVL